MTPILQSIQEDRGPLVAPSRRLTAAVVDDLANLGDARDWHPAFDHERGILTASARGEQGAYTLISFRDEHLLIVARDSQDIDLGGILAREDVGLRVREIARSLVEASQEEERVFKELPQLARHRVSTVSEPECWLLSVADTKGYLYFQTGPSNIQVSRAGEHGAPYTVLIQTGSEFPWRDVTERVRRSPIVHEAIERLVANILP